MQLAAALGGRQVTLALRDRGALVEREGVGSAEARRRRWERQELATPLAASFLGLLLVQGMRAAAAAETAGHGSAPADAAAGTLDHGPTGPMPMVPGAGMVEATVPAIAPGSVLSVGALIDPAALTRLSGEARFAEPAAPPPAAAVATPHLPAAPAPPATADLAQGGGGLMIAVVSPPVPDEAADATEPPVAAPGLHRVGGSGDQTLDLTDGSDRFVGGDGAEHVRGLGGDDRLEGGGGNDWLEGGGGNDTLQGGTGDDLLEGGDGDDLADGGEGDDRLLGGTGADRLLGWSGADQLTGGPGYDRLEGGAGDDILVMDDPFDTVRELTPAVAGGNDTLVVTDGYGTGLARSLPTLAPDGRATFVLGEIDPATFPHGLAGYRQAVDPEIENIRLEGGIGHDIVAGGGANVLEGNAAANRLYGGGGDDRLLGNGGDDWLDGGSGADTLYGGGGDDVFVLGLHEAAPDRIFDHEGANTLRLEGADPSLLHAVRQGADLVLSLGDRTVATIQDHATHADHFTGIDLGQGLRPLETFLSGSPTTAAAPATAAAASDWLAGFLPPSPAEAASLADPWTLTPAEGAAPSPLGPAADEAGLGGADLGGPGAPEAAFLQVSGLEPAPLPDGGVIGGDLWLPLDPLPDAALDPSGLQPPAAETAAGSARGGEEERALAA
jgi:Ca2+-binding RTX toxin-like protein